MVCYFYFFFITDKKFSSLSGIDFRRLVYFGLGIFLFLTAPSLSSNPIFYYICGITLGITSSVLIAFYFMSKLISKVNII